MSAASGIVMTDREYLISIEACSEALDWLGDRSIVEAWPDCPCGEWMLWWAARCPSFVPGGELHRRIGLAACEIARTALVHVPQGEVRPLRAIETAERYWRGEATVEVRAAVAAAEAAAMAAWAAEWAWAAAWAAEAEAHRQHADIVRRYISAEEIVR